MKRRALFVGLPERGHLHPLFGPAAALEAKGFEVAWWLPADARGLLADAGFRTVFVPEGRGPPANDHRGAPFAELLGDPVRLRAWIGKMLVGRVEEDVPELCETLRDFAPDVVATDPMAYAGAIAAHRAGVPWLGLSTSLNPVIPDDWDSELIRTTRALDADRQALCARHGLAARFRVSDLLGTHGTVAFTTPELVGPAPAGVTLAGPSLPTRPRGEPSVDLAFADGRPLLYVSFGTQAYCQPHRYARLFEAVQGSGLALLASAGDLTHGLFRSGLPDEVRCAPFVPQLEVLAQASGFVTHGGANSVMEALAFGVPLGVVPLCNDQPHNLRFVEQVGVGRSLDLSLPTADLRATLVQLCGMEGPWRRRSLALAGAYRARAGAQHAADRLAELAG